MPNHNPFTVAHRIAQLDHMAKGRFHWGVGSGGFPGDFTVYGYDPDTGDHRKMAREAVELILKIWDDPKPGVYESKYWKFEIPEPNDSFNLRFHVKPYQKPHPPIGVAGVSPNSETLLLAGERGWIPMSINLVPPSKLRTHWDAVEKGAQRSGRATDRAIWRIAREVYIADTTEEARKDALNGVLRRDFDLYFQRLLSSTGQLGLMKDDPDMADSDVTPEYLVDNVWIVGSPDDVTRKLQDLHDQVGGFGVLLAMGHEWQPKEKWVNSMTVLAKEVMPRLPSVA
jgi:alkanesulfonate monooxygenase SsuD/methylene tetrahydromethanopterin reductase-like flavin-dependent oxidoreductase (luciferase family)